MLRMPTVLIFVILTFLCWGAYGPVLHLGQEAMGGSRWRPFLCVGIAYFVIAVIGPWVLLRAQPEPGRWTMSGIVWSLIAGGVGAVGALGIILAFQFGGRPVFIMPIVFGCAPVVNTLVTMLMNHNQRDASLPFYLAIGLVALGAAGIFVFKPSVPPPAATSTFESEVESEDTAVGGSAALGSHAVTLRNSPRRVPFRAFLRAELPNKSTADAGAESSRFFDGIKALLAVILTAICWGAYGPMLHKGQAKMEGSRLRPFVCVGMAYFIIAVLVPSVVLLGSDDGAKFTVLGSFWSLIAGAVGAVGALGIIMAFNFGGRPVFVMPLVFGGAPVVNTIISTTQSYLRTGELGLITPPFLAALAMVITGAVLVLLFAPKATAKPNQESAASNPIGEPSIPTSTPHSGDPSSDATDGATDSASVSN